MSNDQQMIDYGPLASLIGRWKGDKGLDISPEEEGEERNHYSEEIVFEAVGDVSNADEQDLVVLFYHQVVTRILDNKKIHNETGYYSWDATNQSLIKSFSIPRGVAITAGGTASQSSNGLKMEVNAAMGDSEWGIVQSPFMQKKAVTKTYLFNLELTGDKLSYSQSMLLDIFDKSFEHTDKNTLIRIS